MAAESDTKALAQAGPQRVLGDDQFREVVGRRSQILLNAASFFVQLHSAGRNPTRPLLGELMSQSIQMEELLDTHGAKNNVRWSPLRSLVAAIKLFSDVSYELLHIRHALPIYRLLPIEHDFAADVDKTLSFTCEVLLRAAGALLKRAHRLGLPIPRCLLLDAAYEESLPLGQLVHDRTTRTIENVPETVSGLATAFLNLAAESERLQVPRGTAPADYPSCIPDPISERHLRHLQHQFHSLQSLYDTYVCETKTENLDRDLPVLRGHISVVFHLLKSATAFSHYYERHVEPHLVQPGETAGMIVAADELLGALMDFSLAYANRYRASAQNLCRDMLKRYAEVGAIQVPVPRYRGFHVRPSTLVAKIVLHYGSDVEMEMDGEMYDASTPLEIFRANEKINARKRRWLAAEVGQLPFMAAARSGEDVAALVRRAVMELTEKHKVVIYEQPLRVSDDLAAADGTVQERVTNEIARLQSTGRIDIECELMINFIGDKRVLADIRLLAENGYGEDNFGNNIPLPRELSYLRR